MKYTDDEKKELKPIELLLDQKTISKRITEMGLEITEDYKYKNPVILGVLKGCIVFLSDLIRTIKLPLELEFVSAASYLKGSTREKSISFSSEIPIDLKDRHVLVVEGVVDTGRTAVKILEEIGKMEPASIEIVTLVDKPASHRTSPVGVRGAAFWASFPLGHHR